jgi:hypothetical protein
LNENETVLFSSTGLPPAPAGKGSLSKLVYTSLSPPISFSLSLLMLNVADSIGMKGKGSDDASVLKKRERKKGEKMWRQKRERKCAQGSVLHLVLWFSLSPFLLRKTKQKRGGRELSLSLSLSLSQVHKCS